MASHSAGLFWLHTLGFFSLTRPSRDAYAVSALVRGTAGSGVACVVASRFGVSSQFMLRTLLLVSPPLQYAPWWPPPATSDTVEISSLSLRKEMPAAAMLRGSARGRRESRASTPASKASWILNAARQRRVRRRQPSSRPTRRWLAPPCFSSSGASDETSFNFEKRLAVGVPTAVRLGIPTVPSTSCTSRFTGGAGRIGAIAGAPRRLERALL